MFVQENQQANIVVATMYKFVQLSNFEEMRPALLQFCVEQNIKGTILLAEEGMNATIAGNRESIDRILTYLRSDQRFADLEAKLSLVADMPFLRMKIKLKKEIVTMGVPETDPTLLSGQRIDAKNWNALISDPDVLVVDARNDYECSIGTFKNAISPETQTFREFPVYAKQYLDPQKHKKIAMFCTGGIRCEKATNYLLREGFENVFHLNGGILKYLEEVPESKSLWEGECFVFDGRVSVDQNLQEGEYEQCFACRRPVSIEEMQSEHYLEGISCPHCIDNVSEQNRLRFRERQRQINLAKRRNQKHLGSNPKIKSSTVEK